MTHDERVYTDPYEFNPERYFTTEGQLNDDTAILTFGFGRRYISLCPFEDLECH